MKKLALVTLMMVGTLSTNSVMAGPSKAPYIAPDVEKSLVKICEALRSDSKLQLKYAIRESRIKPSAISNGLVCNGHDPYTFALLHSADKTATYLANKVNKDISAMLAKR